MNPEAILNQLEREGNLRTLPRQTEDGILDFTSNDYLGLAANPNLAQEFIKHVPELSFTSSASRLLSSRQNIYNELESILENEYGRPALTFNSGYHANTGIIPALTSSGRWLILADRLVHASIIDGIVLSRTEFRRFPHNDMDALRRLLERHHGSYDNIMIATESVFSMDGDEAPLEAILELKKDFPDIFLYLDEAHAFGVKGRHGLGLAQNSMEPDSWDIIVGTFGKATASMGAFAISSSDIKNLLINRARSFIFSTALPPIQIAWTTFVVKRIFEMDKERISLQQLSKHLSGTIQKYQPHHISTVSHIQPLLIGDPRKAISISGALMERGIKAFPIRKPTVPAGTERIRFSLSSAMTSEDIERLDRALKEIYATEIYN